jgi:hypothetical protein
MGKELSLYIRVNRIGIFVNLPLSFDLGAPVQYRPSFSFDERSRKLMKPEFPLFFDVPFYVSLQKRRVVFLLNYHKKA